MTSQKHPFQIENHPFFVTTVTKDRQSFFDKLPAAEIFKRQLYAARAKYGFLLLSFVLMPDHFHAILLPAERNSISDVMRFVKGSVSKALSDELGVAVPVWQAGFYERAIRSHDDFATYVIYIEQNPVEDGLAVAANMYPYSSAHSGNPTDLETYFGGSGGWS